MIAAPSHRPSVTNDTNSCFQSDFGPRSLKNSENSRPSAPTNKSIEVQVHCSVSSFLSTYYATAARDSAPAGLYFPTVIRASASPRACAGDTGAWT